MPVIVNRRSLHRTLLSTSAIVSISAMLLAAGSHQASAQSATWTGATDSYGTATNWAPNNVPASGGTATFAGAGSQTIDLGGLSYTPDAVQVTGGTYTFQNGHFTDTTLSLGNGTTTQFGAIGASRTETTVNSINGFALSHNGTVTLINAGMITAGSDVFNGSGNLTLLNSGTIASVGLVGVNTSGDATVTNAAGGLLQGGSDSVYGNGVNVYGTATVNNYGSIRGGASGANAALQVGAGSTVNLFAGSDTQSLLLGANTSLSIYTGTGTISAGLVDPGTGMVFQQAGTNAAASFGGIQFGANNILNLDGNGDGTVGNGVGGVLADSVSGSVTLYKRDAGTWTLSAANDFMGGIYLYAGTLSAAGNDAFGSATINAYGGGTVELRNAITIGNAIDFDGGTALNVRTGESATYSGNVSNSGEPGYLVKTGGGTLTLTGTNNPQSGTALRGGTVRVGTVAALGSAELLFGGGTLEASADLDFSNGRLVLIDNGGASIDTAGNEVTIGNEIVGIGSDPATLTKSGAGTLVLSGNNNFSGATTVAAGTLEVQGGHAILGTVDVGSPARFVVTDAETIAALSGAAGSSVVLDAALTTGDETNTDFAGVISGTGGLIKQGTGRFSLSGSNTTGNGFLGTLAATGGILAVNGTFGDVDNDTTLVTVGSDASLQGSGTVRGTVNLAGAIAPGNSPGALTLTNLAMQSGAALNYDLSVANDPGSIGNDRLVVTNDLTLDGTLYVGNAAVSGYYRLIDFNTGGAGMLTDNGLSVGTMPMGATGSVYVIDSTGATPGQVNLLLSNGDQNIQFWDGGTGGAGDGTVAGGTGTWGAGNVNWGSAPTGVFNDIWRSDIGIFGGAAGTVTVAGTQAFQGLQFSTDGYVLDGGSLAMTGNAAGNTAASFVNVDAGVTATVGSTLAGASPAIGLDKLGAGRLVLTGDNTYAGGTAILGGTLQLGNGGTTGSILGNVANDGVLAVNHSDMLTFAGAISGTGSLQQIGSGTLLLTGNSIYTGGTLVADGTLQLGNGGTTGSIIGDVVNNGVLAFNRSDAVAMTGTISGTGAVQQLGTGRTTLLASNSYSGGTTIAAGTLVGTSTSFGSGAIVNNAELVFDQDTNGEFAGTVSGSGTIQSLGSGFVRLTGDSSGFSGVTNVDDGVLSVNGTLGGSVSVGTGGRLQGTGTVGPTTVAGTVAPGNSIGTLNVAGNLTFTPTGIYEVEVNAGGGSDKLAVSGVATLAGAAVKVLAASGGYQPLTNYTIITAAGGLSGTFGTVSSNLAFLSPLLSYGVNAVQLTLARNDVSFQEIAATRNQRAAAAGAEALGVPNPLYVALIGADAKTARSAFDQLSGEGHASVKSALISESGRSRDAVGGRLRQAFGEEDLAPTAEGDGPAIDYGHGVTGWGRAFGAWGSVDGNGNAGKVDHDSGGFFVGLDGLVTDNVRLGAVAGYSRSDIDVASRAFSADVDSYTVGLYAGTEFAGFGLNGGVTHTWHQIDTERSVAFAGFSDELSADYDAQTTQAFGELGYKLFAAGAVFEPFAGLAYVNLDTDGFGESGGAAALSSGGNTTDTTYSTLGVRASTGFALGSMNARVNGSLAWQHAYGDDVPDARLAFAGGNGFTIGGVPIAEDAALVQAGFSVDVLDNATLGLSYDGQFGDGTTQNGARLDLSVKF